MRPKDKKAPEHRKKFLSATQQGTSQGLPDRLLAVPTEPGSIDRDAAGVSTHVKTTKSRTEIVASHRDGDQRVLAAARRTGPETPKRAPPHD